MNGLQAEESFRQVEVIAVGEGRLEKSGRDKIVRRWEAALGKQENGRLRGNKSDVSILTMLGIKVHQDGTR